jgi:hypothetical protein
MTDIIQAAKDHHMREYSQVIYRQCFTIVEKVDFSETDIIAREFMCDLECSFSTLVCTPTSISGSYIFEHWHKELAAFREWQ